MNRCAYVAAKHGAFPCILAFAMAAAFLLCCPSQVASAASGSTSLVLKCTLDPENQLKVVGTLSHTAGRFSSTLKSSTEGTHEFRLQAKLAEDVFPFRHSATLSISGLLAAADNASRWRQLSSTIGVTLDRKANPWRPEGKLEVTVREYPSSASRDYSEGTVTIKANRSISQLPGVTVKLQGIAGHKEMPDNPKWTADYMESSLVVQLPLGSHVWGTADASARRRAYPEAPHKTYSRAACKLTGEWTPSKVNSLDCSLTAAATVRENDRSKDKNEATVSAKWTFKPPHAWGADVKVSVGTSRHPNQADAGRPVRGSGGLTLTWTPAESLRLRAAGDVSYGSTIVDEDDDGVYEEGSGDSKVKTGLVFDARLGPLNGITLDGKVSLKRESQQIGDVWEHSNWLPSGEIQASMKF